MTAVFPACHFALPEWLSHYVWPGQVLSSDAERIALAVELSRQQVLHGTGGPFGALVCDLTSGRVIGAGVNLVVPRKMSILHAEVVAWSVAQQVLGHFDLSSDGAMTLGLYTSAQPCIACWGGLFWTGIRHLVYAATKQDVETLAGFDEGPVPSDWIERLQTRGISVACMHQSAAAEVLALYTQQGGAVYNASS